MRNQRAPDFPLGGELALTEDLVAVAEGPGNCSSYHAEWMRLSGVMENAAVAHTHTGMGVKSCGSCTLMTSWI